MDQVDMVDIPLDGSASPQIAEEITRQKTPPLNLKPIDNFDSKLVPKILQYLKPRELLVIQTTCW